MFSACATTPKVNNSPVKTGRNGVVCANGASAAAGKDCKDTEATVVVAADGRQLDLDTAKELVTDLKSINSSQNKMSHQYAPEVQVREIEMPQHDKPVGKVAVFKSLIVPIPSASIHRHAPKVKVTLEKIGTFAASRSVDTIIIVSVAKRDRNFVGSMLDVGIATPMTIAKYEGKTGIQKTTRIKFVSLKSAAAPIFIVKPVGAGT